MDQILRLFYKRNANKKTVDERTPLIITSGNENRIKNKTIIDTLNKDLLVYIFSFLSLEDIPATARTCKIFSNIISEESFWRYLGTTLLEVKPELTKTKITNNNSQMVFIKNQATLFDRYSVIKNRSLNTKNEIYKNQVYANNGLWFLVSLPISILLLGAGLYELGRLINDPQLMFMGILTMALALLSCCFIILPCIYNDMKTNKDRATRLVLLNNTDKKISEKLSAIESVFPEKLENQNLNSELDKQECVVEFSNSKN